MGYSVAQSVLQVHIERVLFCIENTEGLCREYCEEIQIQKNDLKAREDATKLFTVALQELQDNLRLEAERLIARSNTCMLFMSDYSGWFTHGQARQLMELPIQWEIFSWSFKKAIADHC